jgi:hypothetical protein
LLRFPGLQGAITAARPRFQSENSQQKLNSTLRMQFSKNALALVWS